MNGIRPSPEELINSDDERIILRLHSKEPAIIDEVCEYHLNRVGCKTSDISVVRMVSIATQIAFEKILEDAKLVCAYKKNESSLPSMKSIETKELDMESFCTAFQKNDDKFIGLNLDLFLEVPPVEHSTPVGPQQSPPLCSSDATIEGRELPPFLASSAMPAHTVATSQKHR